MTVQHASVALLANKFIMQITKFKEPVNRRQISGVRHLLHGALEAVRKYGGCGNVGRGFHAGRLRSHIGVFRLAVVQVLHLCHWKLRETQGFGIG
jgi:hypothetical protein